jgi:hypothetical protein
MRDKYLYFGLDAAASESFDNQTAQSVTLDTSNFDNPTPDGENFIANGGLKVTITSGAGTTWGSHYGSPVNSAVVEIHPNALTYHATSGAITVATAAADAVYGWTKSATGGENDWVVTQLKPYLAGNGFVYNSRYLRGMHYQSATTTELHFQGKTGEMGATDDVDTITITHGNDKHKEFMQGLTDIIADDKAVSGMVVIADDMRGIVMPHDNASIASVAQTATAS